MRLLLWTCFVIVHVRRLRWGFGVDGSHQTDTLDGDGLFGYEPHSEQGWRGARDRGWLRISHELEKAWYNATTVFRTMCIHLPSTSTSRLVRMKTVYDEVFGSKYDRVTYGDIDEKYPPR
jgi:hypothetical protein